MADSTPISEGVKPLERPPKDVCTHSYHPGFLPTFIHKANSISSPQIAVILAIEAELVLPSFTTHTAWALGCFLHERLLQFPVPAVISITHANTSQILFHACTHPGVTPDNDIWVTRKRKTVLRWGVSTWSMGCKFGGDEVAFGEKYGLGEKRGEYAIHGGGLPIRVKGVEGIVGVAIVSGLKQWEDHAVVVEALTNFCE